MKAIIPLYSNDWVQLKQVPEGTLTKKVRVDKELKQGCVLAPILFDLFVADMEMSIVNPRAFPPRINNCKFRILQFAYDMALLDYTYIGLQHSLNNIYKYCQQSNLVIHYEKTKVITFTKKENQEESGNGRKFDYQQSIIQIFRSGI